MKQFVSDAGFVIGNGALLPAGTPDDRAARWIQRSALDLIVLPYHLHRGEGGQVLDGVGVLLLLPRAELLARTRFFMPVRKFSWGASFQRRLELVKERRPDLIPRLIACHQDEIGKGTVLARLRRVLEAARAAGPLPLPISVPPSSRSQFVDFGARPLGVGSHRSEPISTHAPPSSSNAELSATRLRVRPIYRSPSSPPPSSRVRDGIESAKKSFRRATEIGAQAQKDFEAERAKRRRR